MPQYADGCLSEESRTLIEAHIGSCESCKRELDEVRTLFASEIRHDAEAEPIGAKKALVGRVSIFRASVLQSALLYGAFLLIVFGVWREASTPAGSINGLWGVFLVVPATAFLLSLANWYFVRFYASKKAFSTCSLLIYLAFLAICAVWAVLHYSSEFKDLFEGAALSTALPVIGIVLSIALGALSYLGSAKYAALLGKA